MTRIYRLPTELVSRIAAGEVVERPASVLKELIENSLDAGADDIGIIIEGAGRTRLQVSDNGWGMTKEEAFLSLERHATSKISRLEDLDTLQTFGFRGEALPSIAAVSRFRMSTRSREDDSGWEFTLEGGKLVSERPIAREPGTTIEVRDLFFNTPARFKFLKSDTTERSQCLRVVEEMVFSALHASFHLQSEQTKPVAFRSMGAETMEEELGRLKARLTEAWGGRWGSGLAAVSTRSPHFALHGLVTNQGNHQATPRYQYLFVNRRPVQSRRLTRAIYDGFQGQLPSLRHPGWVLFLEIDPRTVDVNVHPTKKEVKLSHESEIYGFFVGAVRQALGRTDEIPVQLFSPPEPSSVAVHEGRAEKGYEGSGERFFKERGERIPEGVKKYQPSGILSPLSSTHPSSSLFPAVAPERLDLADLKVVAQVRKMFILAHSAHGVVIADQHAAAEKVMYERLIKNLREKEPQVQMLLVPFTWEVSMSVQAQVADNLPLLRSMGFWLEPFGGNAFVVKGYPIHLGEKVELHSLLDSLTDELSGAGGPKIEHRLAAMAACKASVKAGDPLDIGSCEKILRELSTCEAPWTCPHGRPTVIRLTYEDLEHRFRR